MFRQLSFDTSSSAVHLALLEEGHLIASEVIQAEKEKVSTQSRQQVASILIPSIGRLMAETGWKKEELDCLVVGTGPGGFTSIRIAVVTGRTLAQALRLPILPVSLLETYNSLIDGICIIALQATTDHFFLAKTEDGKTSASYVNQTDLGRFIPERSVIYADNLAKTQFIKLSESEPLLSNSEINDLPSLPNIAAQQGKCAWQKLSSRVSKFYDSHLVWQVNEADQKRWIVNFRNEMFQEFSYELVVPTYLRAPSITLKKANV